jgi:hypothetical protein
VKTKKKKGWGSRRQRKILRGAKEGKKVKAILYSDFLNMGFMDHM